MFVAVRSAFVRAQNRCADLDRKCNNGRCAQRYVASHREAIARNFGCSDYTQQSTIDKFEREGSHNDHNE